LVLSDCGFTPHQVASIAKALEDNLKLETLNLSYNRIDLKQEAVVAEFLSSMSTFLLHNRSLVHVNFSGMQLGSKLIPIAESISRSPSITSVHLSDNGSTSFEIDHIFEIFRLRSSMAVGKMSMLE
jgi:Ran GTPase-activating protein (RanGAP) involved in mRNA processing and transport